MEYFLYSLLVVINAVFISAEAGNKVERKEIAAAAAESRNLAEELAALLFRLEGGGDAAIEDKPAIVDSTDNEEDILDTEESFQTKKNVLRQEDREPKRVSTKEEIQSKVSSNEAINDFNSRIKILRNNSLQLVKDTTLSNKESVVRKDNISDDKSEIQKELEQEQIVAESSEIKDDLSIVETILDELSGRITILETNQQESPRTDGTAIDPSSVKDIIEIGSNIDNVRIIELGSKLNDRENNELRTFQNKDDGSEHNIEPVVFNLDNADYGYYKQISDKTQEEIRKEERLKSSLDKLEKVAKEIEELAKSAKSDEEIATVHQLTQILEDMATALTLEEVRLSVNVTLNKQEKNNKFEALEESVDSMLEYLKGIMKELREQAIYNEQIINQNKNSRQPKVIEESHAGDVKIFLVNDETTDDKEKKLRQARYRNMLTKFYFGNYWDI